MSTDAKFEKKVVSDLAKFLADVWPIVRPFVDADKVRQRSVELGDPG
jgi:hypothetical protein